MMATIIVATMIDEKRIVRTAARTMMAKIMAVTMIGTERIVRPYWLELISLRMPLEVPHPSLIVTTGMGTKSVCARGARAGRSGRRR
jgi:hypothetical protein